MVNPYHQRRNMETWTLVPGVSPTYYINRMNGFMIAMTIQGTWNLGEPFVHKHQLGIKTHQFALQFLAWWCLWSCNRQCPDGRPWSWPSWRTRLDLWPSPCSSRSPWWGIQHHIRFVDAACVKKMDMYLHAWRTESKAHRNSWQTSPKHFLASILYICYQWFKCGLNLCVVILARSLWCS